MKSNLSGAKIVCIKELKEMIRDRRVLIAALVMPIFMVALFVILIGTISNTFKAPQGITIAQVGPQTDLTKALSSNPEAIELVPNDSLPKALADLRAGNVRLVLQTNSNSQNDNQQKLTVHFLSDSPKSQIAAGIIREAVAQANKASLQSTLTTNKIPLESAEPIVIETKDAAAKDGLAGSAMVDLIPYLIVLWAFYGGMSIVSDLVSGEKERGTMETLLISPISRTEVALGKILALATVCFVSASTTFVGIAILGVLNLESTKELFGSGLSFSPGSILSLIMILTTLVTFFAAMMVAISAFAKNIRESQTYLSLISFAILLPAVFSQFIGFTDAESQSWVKLTPVLNSSLGIKDALKSKIDPTLVASCVCINTFLAGICILAAIYLFKKEAILTRV